MRATTLHPSLALARFDDWRRTHLHFYLIRRVRVKSQVSDSNRGSRLTRAEFWPAELTWRRRA